MTQHSRVVDINLPTGKSMVYTRGRDCSSHWKTIDGGVNPQLLRWSFGISPTSKHIQIHEHTWVNSALTPNRLLMSSSYIYITNIIIPNIDISTCTNPPKTCSFPHDALPASHLFLVVWAFPPSGEGRNPQASRLNPQATPSSGHKMLKRLRAACSKSEVSVPQRSWRLSKVNQFESHQKRTPGEWGGQIRLGIVDV